MSAAHNEGRTLLGDGQGEKVIGHLIPYTL